MERQYENEVVGFNTRMTDIHAAIGRVQLTKVGGWTEQRQENAAFLTPTWTASSPPPVADGAVHVYHQYTVRVPEDRDGFAAALREEHNVGSGMFYPMPNHRLPPFQFDVDLPETERAAARVPVAAGAPLADRRPTSSDRRRRSTPSPRRVPDGATCAPASSASG